MTDNALRDAFDDYFKARLALELRLRGWEVPAPDGPLREPSELDCAEAADRLRGLLDPGSPPTDGPWIRMDATASADQLIEVADSRARQCADTAAASIPPHEETDK